MGQQRLLSNTTLDKTNHIGYTPRPDREQARPASPSLLWPEAKCRGPTRPVRAAGSRWGGTPKVLGQAHYRASTGSWLPSASSRCEQRPARMRAATPVPGHDRHEMAAPDLFCPSGHSHPGGTRRPPRSASAGAAPVARSPSTARTAQRRARNSNNPALSSPPPLGGGRVGVRASNRQRCTPSNVRSQPSSIPDYGDSFNNPRTPDVEPAAFLHCSLVSTAWLRGKPSPVSSTGRRKPGWYSGWRETSASASCGAFANRRDKFGAGQ